MRHFDCIKGHVVEVVERFYGCQACVIERCRVEQALAHQGEACAVEIRPSPFGWLMVLPLGVWMAYTAFDLRPDVMIVHPLTPDF